MYVSRKFIRFEGEGLGLISMKATERPLEIVPNLLETLNPKPYVLRGT